MTPHNESRLRAALTQAGAPELFHAGIVRLVAGFIADEIEMALIRWRATFDMPALAGERAIGFRAGDL
jgi:hypothetical protein